MSLPAAVSAWVNAGAAFSTFQPLTVASWAISRSPESTSGSKTEWAPFWNSTALLSTSVPPFIMMILGLSTPCASRQSTRVWAWSLPTSSLSKET